MVDLLEVIRHECDVHGFQLCTERDIRLESKKKKRRTYEVSTGRAKKKFSGERLTQQYFDVSLISVNDATGEMVRSPALCIGKIFSVINFFL